jgi:hypothetical protein
LCCRIRRDKCGNLGIQIKAGSDGGLYVQSVVPGGPAAAVGSVHRGTAVLYELYYMIYRMSQEECARLREGVPYVKVY